MDGERRSLPGKAMLVLLFLAGASGAAMNGLNALRMAAAEGIPGYSIAIGVGLALTCVALLFLAMHQKVTIVGGTLTVRNGLGQTQSAHLDGLLAAAIGSPGTGFVVRDSEGRFRRVGFLHTARISQADCDTLRAVLDDRFGLDRLVPRRGSGRFSRAILRLSAMRMIVCWFFLFVGSVAAFAAFEHAARSPQAIFALLLVPAGTVCLFPFFVTLDILRGRRLFREGQFEKLGYVLPKARASASSQPGAMNPPAAEANP